MNEPEVTTDLDAEVQENLLPPLFQSIEQVEPPKPDPVPPGPQILATEPEQAPQPVPPSLEQQLPDLPAVRNRMGDMRQDLNLITNRLAQIQTYQSPELAQACIRATEFMVWIDMAIQKAEAEEAARANGFDIRPRDIQQQQQHPLS